MYDRFVSSIPLTQNSLESWHNRWNTLLHRKKWNIYRTIEEFQKEQKNTQGIIERIISSEPIAKRKRVSYHGERLRKHFEKKTEMDMKSYLSGLAHICYIKK